MPKDENCDLHYPEIDHPEIDHPELRATIRAVRYQWVVKDAGRSAWQLLNQKYSMREMSQLLREGRFADIEIVETRSELNE
jgi:hypothetical protein